MSDRNTFSLVKLPYNPYLAYPFFRGVRLNPSIGNIQENSRYSLLLEKLYMKSRSAGPSR